MSAVSSSLLVDSLGNVSKPNRCMECLFAALGHVMSSFHCIILVLAFGSWQGDPDSQRSFTQTNANVQPDQEPRRVSQKSRERANQSVKASSSSHAQRETSQLPMSSTVDSFACARAQSHSEASDSLPRPSSRRTVASVSASTASQPPIESSQDTQVSSHASHALSPSSSWADDAYFSQPPAAASSHHSSQRSLQLIQSQASSTTQASPARNVVSDAALASTSVTPSQSLMHTVQTAAALSERSAGVVLPALAWQERTAILDGYRLVSPCGLTIISRSRSNASLIDRGFICCRGVENS